DNFGGNSWPLTTDTPSFSAYSGLNDNMTSCRITSGSSPPVPTGLTGTPGNAQVRLSWSASAGAASYNLKRSLTNGVPGAPVGSTIGTSYIDTSLANGTTYYYQLSAIN